MIYSKKHDFLFIKGKKVAGTSVEMALSATCGPDDIIAPITPVDELERVKFAGRGAQNYSEDRAAEVEYLDKLTSSPSSELWLLRKPRRIYGSHISLANFARRYGRLPTKRIFCVERNPYAKILSSLNMNSTFKSYKREGGEMEFDLNLLRQSVANWFNRTSMKCNMDRYRDSDGKVSIRVLRFETLEGDFSKLMAEYGIDSVPKLPHAKKGANANILDPLELFTAAQLERINEVYAEAFDTFGYERLEPGLSRSKPAGASYSCLKTPARHVVAPARKVSMKSTPNPGPYSDAPEFGLYGKWRPEVRMSGLESLAQSCIGKTVLDLGTAEGLIAMRFLEGGAAAVHGVDIVPERISAAQRICRDFSNADFWEADLSDWKVFWAGHDGRLLPSYDIVLYLGLHHQLSAEARTATLVNAARVSSKVIALRTRDACYKNEDMKGRLTGLGFGLVSEHCNRAVAQLGALQVFSRCAQATGQP